MLRAKLRQVRERILTRIPMMPRSGTNTLSFWEFLWYDVENLLRNFDLDLKKKKEEKHSVE